MMNNGQQNPGHERAAERAKSEVKLEVTVLVESCRICVSKDVDPLWPGPGSSQELPGR